VSLTVKFKGDSSSFDKALNRVKSGVKSVATPITAAAKGVAVLGAAFTAAAVAAAAFTYKMVKIGEEANTQNARLQNVVKQMGLFGSEAGKVSDRLIKFAEAQARLIGGDDKVIKQTQAKLATFANLAETADEVGGAFDRATVAALDMAAAGFGTAEANAVQLGKALQDPIKGITALGRAGVTFTDQERAKIAALVESNRLLEAQDIVLKAIEKQVGGTAAATANATAQLGAMRQQLVNAFAKPVADSFARLTVTAERTFQQLESKFESAGETFGNALERMIEGDSSRFIKIGEMIGQLVMDGMKMAASAGGWAFSEKLWESVADFARSDYAKFTPLPRGEGVASFAEGQMGDAARFRGQTFESQLADSIKNLNKNLEEMRRQRMEDAVYNKGVRAGGTDRITDPATVERIFKEYLEEQKKTNAYLEREEQDRKGL
jgi:hypothetical protein